MHKNLRNPIILVVIMKQIKRMIINFYSFFFIISKMIILKLYMVTLAQDAPRKVQRLC